MTLDQEETLHKLLFGALTQPVFEQTWEDEVGPLENEVCVAFHSWKLPKHGVSNVYILSSRLVVVENSRSKWSAYATKAFTDEREYFASWASFVRGTWVERVPQQPGTYPTKDREGARSKDRTLIRKDGKLLDVTCCAGKVEWGRVSNWRGFWFSAPYPPLRGAS